ncbi:hypothetical protein IPL68_05635 [Candidatus Saccharibacteria bacterium]|nr:MAG: hypothetical protein IPL68_05635 [Candidatus Saccharibacteria bacterium]
MKKNRTKQFPEVVVTLVASSWFWRIMLGLFIVQAVYIALVGRFSMAFDEHFRLAAIQEYAKVLFPWQVTQPPGPAELSAFTADGSYLYHYLMSWPYRLMTLVTSSTTAHIVMMRLIDVGLVVAGFMVFRRLLFELRVSKAAAQVILGLILLMPMTPFLAGQLTYDALFFTMCAVTMLLLFRLARMLYGSHMIPLPLMLWTGTAVLVTLQIKYAFFPAVLGAVLYMTSLVIWLCRAKKLSVARMWKLWIVSAKSGAGMVALGVFLLCGVLFVQRYGMNYLQYGSLVPECPAVLGHERCLGFAPYGRDAEIREMGWYSSISSEQKVEYVKVWYEKMVYESYFSVGPKEIAYPTADPLHVPYVTGRVLAALAVAIIVIRIPWILRSGVYAQLAFAVLATYTAFLF